MNGQLSENFHRSELQCRHCGHLVLDTEALAALQRLRDALGRPVRVLSGYRCKIHNAAVGGATRSYHLTGQAFDIWIEPDTDEFRHVAALALEAGFTGFGVYSWGLHLDTGPKRTWWQRNEHPVPIE